MHSLDLSLHFSLLTSSFLIHHQTISRTHPLYFTPRYSRALSRRLHFAYFCALQRKKIARCQTCDLASRSSYQVPRETTNTVLSLSLSSLTHSAHWTVATHINFHFEAIAWINKHAMPTYRIGKFFFSLSLLRGSEISASRPSILLNLILQRVLNLVAPNAKLLPVANLLSLRARFGSGRG